MDLSLASKVRSVTHGYRRLVNMVICMGLGDQRSYISMISSILGAAAHEVL